MQHEILSNSNQFVEPSAQEKRAAHELAGLVLQGTGPSEEAMVATEPELTAAQRMMIVETANNIVPDKRAEQHVVRSRSHTGHGPDGRGFSYTDYQLLQERRAKAADPAYGLGQLGERIAHTRNLTN